MTLFGSSSRFARFLVSLPGKQRYFIHSSKLCSSNTLFSKVTVEQACPQGIQGDNDANTRLWWDTCKSYGLSDCENQLQGIQSGRKTLGQVLAEQDAIIRMIAEKYKNEADRTLDSMQGVQDYTYLPSIHSPCPQGIQGDECAQYKIWLENCHHFGLQNCLDQYESIRFGQKSLSDIFKEQDILIRSIVKQYQQKPNYSTLSNSTSQAGSAIHTGEPIKKPSQKDRLKQAVRDYGSTVIVFHVGISLISLGGFYLAVSSGIDMVEILTKLGVGETILQSKVVSGAGTFVVAYAVHKVFAPLRIAITLTSTPFIVSYLRRAGVLKIPKIK